MSVKDMPNDRKRIEIAQYGLDAISHQANVWVIGQKGFFAQSLESPGQECHFAASS